LAAWLLRASDELGAAAAVDAWRRERSEGSLVRMLIDAGAARPDVRSLALQVLAPSPLDTLVRAALGLPGTVPLVDP
jgi:hypothetical protein